MYGGYWIEARDTPGLLIAMMNLFLGKAHIAFEGDLSKCMLSEIQGSSSSETQILKRNTTFPLQDFIILPLEIETIEPILKQVLPQAKCVHDIDHISIEKNGNLVFAANDNFDSGCIWVGDAVTKEFLEDLLTRRIIKSYELATI